MKVIDNHGRPWRVGRRVLLWRTRPGWVPGMLYVGGGLLFSEGFFFGALILILSIPVAIGLLLSWLASVVLAPFVMLGQALDTWPTYVVAYLIRDRDGRPAPDDDTSKDRLWIMKEERFRVRRIRVLDSAEADRLITDLGRCISQGCNHPWTETCRRLRYLPTIEQPLTVGGEL